MTKEQVSRWFTFALLVLAIAPANTTARAQGIFTPLYYFNPANYDPTGFVPPGTLAQGQDGNIYTTSCCGGAYNNQGTEEAGAGNIFGMTPAGVLLQPPLFTFNPLAPIGETPYSGLNLGTDGNLYGAVLAGYGNEGPDHNCSNLGSIFGIQPDGSFSFVYSFPISGAQGGTPYQAPVQATDGNLYGASDSGSCAVPETPQIYQLTPAGALTPITTGTGYFSLYLQGTDGDLYGSYEATEIFKLTTSGVYTPLYSGDNNSFQVAGLIQGSDGNFYGTSHFGGTYPDQGFVFKMTSRGKLTVLHYFDPQTADGYYPYGGVVQGTDGNLYGVTQAGGANGFGTIYSISTKGTGYSILYPFDGATAAYPEIALLQHTNGKLYGLSYEGGINNNGTFYSFDVGLKPFVRLASTSGAVGSTVGILGQGFSSSSVVKFGGVAASATVATGTTFITATVPSGAKTGSVTVKTGKVTLKSSKKFNVIL
jgi:uncharacterized repeat protein (TIGR03803 family)